MVAFKGALWFAGSRPSAGGGTDPAGVELWRSDGTAEGTALFKDLRTGPDSGRPNRLTVSGGLMFFSAVGPHDGAVRLWRTDGTPEGTFATREVFPDAMFDLNGTFYFTAPGPWGDGKAALYRSNGTAFGTVYVADLPAGAARWTVTGGRLFFTAEAPGTGRELWTSDGTAAGTRMVTEIASGPASAAVDFLHPVGRHVYFQARDPAGGAELWRSDGTPEGTARVADVVPGPAGSGARPLVEVNGNLLFSAATPEYGTELWVTDGTVAGTALFQDLNPGPGSSNPSHPALVGTGLYFRAFDEIHGAELWKVDAPDLPPGAAARVTGRYVFYNNSVFDGFGPAGTLADLAAVAPDKHALLPGEAGSFANVTSSPKGLNGIVVEFDRMLPGGALGAGDFDFRAGRSGDPADWTVVTMPAGVTPVPNPSAPGAGRYVITFADGSVTNTWLQVTVKANASTGLAAPDVFYYGNLVGETGDAAIGALRVTATDVTRTRLNLFRREGLTGRYDFDRSSLVTAGDLLTARRALGQALPVFTALGVRAPALSSAPQFTAPPPAMRSLFADRRFHLAVGRSGAGDKTDEQQEPV